MIDLHIHSNYSDGLFSVKELTNMIKKSDLEFCSLTDHDTVDGVEEFVNSFKREKTTAIPGVELTALFNNREIHILAYNFDINKVKVILNRRNKILNQQKIIELESAKKLFIKQGFEVSDSLNVDRGNPVGLTVALDVYNNFKNQSVLLRRHGKKVSPEEFYYLYQSPKAPCFVPRSGVAIEWILKQFKNIAGDLILAHPFNSVSFLTPALSLNEINNIIALGINGIEVYHPELNETQINNLKKIVQEKKLRFTGGSDFHGRNNNQKIGYYSENLPIKLFKLYGMQNN